MSTRKQKTALQYIKRLKITKKPMEHPKYLCKHSKNFIEYMHDTHWITNIPFEKVIVPLVNHHIFALNLAFSNPVKLLTSSFAT